MIEFIESEKEKIETIEITAELDALNKNINHTKPCLLGGSACNKCSACDGLEDLI